MPTKTPLFSSLHVEILAISLFLSESLLLAAATISEVCFLRRKGWATGQSWVLHPFVSNLLGLIFGAIAFYASVLLFALGILFLSYNLSGWIKDDTLEGVATVAGVIVFIVLVVLATWFPILVTRLLVTSVAVIHGSKFTWRYSFVLSILTTAWLITGFLLAVMLTGGYLVALEELGVKPN